MSVAVGDIKKLHGVPKDMESVDALVHKKDKRVRKEFEKWAFLILLSAINLKGRANESVADGSY